MHAKSKGRTSRRGVAVVEFAMVFPIIVFIFSIMIEISRILLLQHTADTAAYEGARVGMVPGACAAEVHEAANELLDATRLKSCVITVQPQTISEETALITVRVQIPVRENSWIMPTNFTNLSVASEVTLFCERSPVVRLTGVPELKLKHGSMGGRKPSL